MMAQTAKRPKAKVGEKALKLQDPMVRGLLNLEAGAGLPSMPRARFPGHPWKWQHRVPVVWPERKLIPFLDRAWSDPGGTALFGPGEYLQVPCMHPDDPPHAGYERTIRVRCPLGQVGDRLWVGEFIRRDPRLTRYHYYRADGAPVDKALHRKLGVLHGRPSFRAPDWAARIWLEITRVRLQRTFQITTVDARAEGMGSLSDYVMHWDRLHGKAGHWWGTNPWMWVLELRRLPVG